MRNEIAIVVILLTMGVLAFITFNSRQSSENRVVDDVSPNEVIGSGYLKFEDFTQDYTVFVLDASGQQIDYLEIAGGESEANVDLSRQPSGVYFFNISNGEMVSSEKIIKM